MQLKIYPVGEKVFAAWDVGRGFGHEHPPYPPQGGN